MNFQTILEQSQDLAFSFDAQAAPDSFVVTQFEGRDALFDGYELVIDLASFNPDLDLTALVDTEACLTIHDKYSQPRYFHGVIAEAEAGDTGFSRSFYRVVLKPSLHRLQYISDSRIFQEQTAQDIISALLQENGIPEVTWNINEDHLVREYCVQYGETTYDFILRLMAEEGMFFWFEHSPSSHKMIISDSPWTMPILANAETITYNAMTGGQTRGSYVRSFRQTQRVRATDFHQKDYTFKRPLYGQDQKHGQHESAGEKAAYELYDYPGRYKNPGAGKPFTKYKMEAARVSANLGVGETNNVHLCSGYCFTLEDHPSAKANALHRVLEVQHKGTQPAAMEEEAREVIGDGADAATRYDATFTTMPQRIPYRAANPNPKPQILGSQIATVTGPAGEEIYCDEHGRVKVFFPWDRHGKKDENASCWIRVAQSSGGGGWGHVAVPRIGNEVVVDFLEGDPDQPVILGMTFNSVNRPPYQLPGNKTKMALRSQTHKGDGHSEISFEDTAGSEEMFIHAQKDQNIKVLNNQSANVMANRVENIGANASVAIAANQQERVGANKNVTVGGDGLGLLQMLMPLVQAGGKSMLKGTQKAGAPADVQLFATGVAGVADMPKELAAIALKGSFGGSGGHKTGAGAAQSKTGAIMSSLMGMIFPSSGTLNQTVEKFKKESIGQAATEQVGIAKNITVGQVMTTSVGKLMQTKVGEDYELETKKSIFNRTSKHTLHAKDKFVIAGPGGTIILDKSGVTIKAKSIKFKSPSIDFSSGSPDQVDALKSDKAFSQDCAASGKGGVKKQ